MRTITLIIIHCSATCEDRPFTEQALEAAHRQRGFDGTGYPSTSVATAAYSPPAPPNAPEHMPAATTPTQ